MKQVADDLGITEPSLSRAERGVGKPSYAVALKLARWLGWTVEQVMEAA